ncbi:unnamed protein product [Malus baccata var. baccata]
MEGHCNDDLMEDEIVEAMPRRIKGSGGFKAPSKTLDHPNITPSFPIAIPPILWLTLLIAALLLLLLNSKTISGYALIEYEKFEEAKAAILGMNGAKLFWSDHIWSPNRSRNSRRRY